MAIIIDILLLLIVFLSVLIGVKRGFIKSVKGIVALILAVIAANCFSPYLASYFKEHLFEEAIRSNVERQFDQIVTTDPNTGEYLDPETYEPIDPTTSDLGGVGALVDDSLSIHADGTNETENGYSEEDEANMNVD